VNDSRHAPSANPNHPTRWRRWRLPLILLGATAVIAGLIGWLPRQPRTELDRETARLFAIVRREERTEKPFFRWLPGLRDWPQPFPHVARLVLGTGEGDEWESRQKISALGGQVVPVLHEALQNDRSQAVRALAASLLSELGTPDSFSVLTNALVSDRSAKVREAIADALQQQPAPGALPVLFAAFRREGDPEVAGSILETAAYVGGSEVLSVLTNVLVSHTNSFVRSVAASALGRLKNRRRLRACWPHCRGSKTPRRARTSSNRSRASATRPRERR
jgi:hypothetical protein